MTPLERVGARRAVDTAGEPVPCPPGLSFLKSCAYIGIVGSRDIPLDELSFWFPDTAAEIRCLEREVAARGITTNRWGVKPPSPGRAAAGRLCADCVVA